MLTRELIAEIANKTGMTKRRTEELLEGTISTITDSIRNGQNVQLQGLGTLELKQTKERTMVHPKTGERSRIPAGTKLTFRATNSLKDELK